MWCDREWLPSPGHLLAHSGSFSQDGHEKGVTMRVGVPRAVSRKAGRATGLSAHPGLGDLLTDWSGLGLMGLVYV